MPREQSASRGREPRRRADLLFVVPLNRETAKIAKLCGDFCKEARILMPMRHPTDECIEWNESALTASRESENVESEKNNLLSLGMQLH